MKPANHRLDAVALEIFRNAIESVVDECFVTLMKSAYSSNIKERRDHSVALFDPSARLIAQARQSLPIHLGSLSGLVEALLSRKAELAPGDILIANDPYEAGGTHLPDLNFAMPVFDGGQLVCFVCNIAHHSDFGGMVPGSMAGGMHEIYQEGLRVPLVWLYRSGELVADVFNLVLINTRVRSERKGDLLAQVAACRLGARRIGELLQTYPLQTARHAFEELMRRTEDRIRGAVEELPDGDYSFADVMDDDGLDERDIPIQVKVSIRGRRMHVDFAGSAPQVPGNINCTRSATRSAICYAIKALLDPDVPNNQGVFDAIEWSAPPASIVDAAYPAAVANRAHTVQRIIDAIIGAMAKAIPDRVVAAANGANTTAVFTGVRPGTGERYIYFETLGGGFGARASKDGKDGVQVHITNTSNLPVEVIEMEYPLFVESYGFEPDSGGAGRFRGGLGLRRVIRPLGHRCTFSGSGERFVHAPWGVFGGRDGAPGRFQLRKAHGELERLRNKPTAVEFSAEEAVIIVTPGAGGYGRAEERAAGAIREDLISQKFSSASVASSYPGAMGKAVEI
jgi:N-methylhydantoinase B